MRVYIAGPMTGITEWNYPAFFDAERQLTALGHQVINPARTDGDTLEKALAAAGSPEEPSQSWDYYLRRDVVHVTEVDALCLLPGWQKSRGAKLEAHIAKALGLQMLVLRDGQLVPRVQAIGLSGYARSGKDTVGAYLVEHHGYQRVSFADPMREALYALNPFIDVDGWDVSVREAVDAFGWEKLKTKSFTIRPLMQRLGTEVGRNMFGTDFWVDLAMSRIPDGSKVVFTDVRFPNEAEAVKAVGGQVWRITRPGLTAANNHPSETAVDDYQFDKFIDNSSSLASLYKEVEKAL